MQRLLIATSNPGKLREVRAILAGLDVAVLSLDDVGSAAQPVEDGATFLQNARKKALHYARASGEWTLADDSGLEVDALGGAPGIRSARYAGENASDAANNARLMRDLADVPAHRRTARFRCAMALAAPGKVVATSTAAIEGFLLDAPRGQNGFGYDPYFLLADRNQTAAELRPEEKNRISHRARALAVIKPRLVAFLEL